MESRRHGHGGRRNFEHNGGRRFRRGGGRGGGPVWFKGEGYNDHECVQIAEEVAGISGFLHSQQTGFPGTLKQRYADCVVHELSQRSQTPVMLSRPAKKSKSVQLTFQERVLDFVLGAVGSKEEQKKTNDTQAATEKKRKDEMLPVVRQLAHKMQQVATQQSKLGLEAQEAYHLRQLVLLVTREIGEKKGKEFEQFLDKVEQAHAEFEAKRKEEKEKRDEKGGNAVSAAAAAAADGLTFYLGGLNEKGDRVFIHETMRRYGKTRIVADTLNIGSDTSVIRVRPTFAVKLLPGERDSRRDWPVGQPDYLQFTLYKRNKDTSAVINQLASMLKISPALFSYADVKEKRGITTQLCTVYRVPKDRAQVVFRPGGSRRLEDQQYLVGDLRYASRKLELGDCAGNRIAMVVRSLPEDEKKLPESAVRKAVRSWEIHGFINFFGLQRFGNASTSYHLLGRSMLRKDYKLATLLLLRPQDGEASKIRAAREHFRQHKDVAAALRMLPPFLIPERAVLEGLQQHGIDAHELAFGNVPKLLRASYIEAYQDFVWNEMASMRIAKFSSTSAVVGDLVLVPNSEVKTVSAPGKVKEGIEPPKKRQKTGKKTKRQPMQQVMSLTEENVDQYLIDDVVLPLPGHAVEYPANEVGAAYRKMITTDGIDLNAQFAPDGSQPFPLDGSYRHLVKKPRRVSFWLERYEDATKPLIPNDVDQLLARSSQDNVRVESTQPKQEQEKPQHRALVLEFDLDYGSDAMIAVRELMKQSSSAHVHWQTASSDMISSEAASGKTVDGSSVANSSGNSARAATASSQARKPGRGDSRKVITAQKKTQVAIGRPGFSLGRS
ncbi:hypothetical protein BBO99_00009548 [Phytophthora kernoviae]|uniref:TRUD domain-containing protein n=2 Tax=Phytophthora kernoviae TaxID=325452 RepID=A0A3R7J266_9STRA|nr:hypothetical protein G195_011286 [Phytophthora kernoviae 00238/432]KAG2503030.1 hypothetical protein JM16_009471 [Phytophthora kernoviae]KAG2505217.1 hypothetical protein JM18_009295 [Phytophthora kernoviae]RLN37589.1 hypothetical protein BBI17_009601 [Phytophthora kernoviae]RLN73096.1 hypothetical protein BBO99_00009548 [Phytophthora kernoviae]